MRSHLKLMHMSAKTGMRQNKDLSSFMRDDALDCICLDGTREKMDAGSMERMKFIGITGGVGAGKSEILHYLETKDGVKVMLADEIAHELMLPGTECYQKLKDMFSDEDIWNEDGSFDRKKLATVIFSDEKKTGCIKRNRTSGSQKIYQNCCGYRAGKWSAENPGFRGSIAD